MASVIAESRVGAIDTVRVDACPVDRIPSQKKAIHSHGRLNPSDCIGPVECIDGGVEFQSVEVLGIGGPIYEI